MIIAVKHLFELPFSLLMGLFFNCKLKCRFFSFRLCKIYVFIIYFVLLVQDFIFMTPPIWIFAYHILLLIAIFVVSLRQSNNKSKKKKEADANTEQPLNPNEYVQINEQNEEIAISEDNEASTAS